MSEEWRALVVDDEAAVRQLTTLALQQRGFKCDQAEDGEHALQLVRQNRYDAIVTDLRMPRRHGHSLATEVLQHITPKPVLVVLTGVAEPRLALDLLDRGVDDLILKPVDFRVLAAKVHTLCSKRASNQPVTPAEQGDRTSTPSLQMNALDAERVGDDECRRALELAKLLRSEPKDPNSILTMLDEIPEMGQEIRRTARWLQFAISKERSANDLEVICEMDCNFVADIMVVSALQRMVRLGRSAWIDPDLIYRRSSFATILLAHALPQHAFVQKRDVLLATILVPLMRPLAAQLAAAVYQDLVRESVETDHSLGMLEKRHGLPAPTKAIKPILLRWGIAPSVIKLIEFSHLSHREVHSLRSSFRSDTSRIKLAGLLGQIAQGSFDPWDEIDIPSATISQRLGFRRPAQLVHSICERFGDIVGCNDKRPIGIADSTSDRKLRCARLSSHTESPFSVLLKAMGYPLVSPSRSDRYSETTDLINAIDARPERVRQYVDKWRCSSSLVIVSDEALHLEPETQCSVIQLPCSAARLAKQLCRLAAQARVENRGSANRPSASSGQASEATLFGL